MTPPVDTQDVAAMAGASTSQNALSATDPVSLDQTSSLLEEHGLATPEELNQLRQHGLAPLQGPRPWDSLEFLAALRVRDADARPVEVERLGRALSQVMGQPLTLIPFGNRMQPPATFLEANPDLVIECKKSLTPLLFAEESEAIGIGSINPVALRIVSKKIVANVEQRFGTKPIVSRMLLHHDGWITLCQKQFGL